MIDWFSIGGRDVVLILSGFALTLGWDLVKPTALRLFVTRSARVTALRRAEAERLSRDALGHTLYAMATYHNILAGLLFAAMMLIVTVGLLLMEGSATNWITAAWGWLSLACGFTAAVEARRGIRRRRTLALADTMRKGPDASAPDPS